MPANNMRINENKIIRNSSVVNSPIDTIWWKWTTHEGLKTFFGEDNKISLTIGGPFEIYFSMDAPEGERGSEGCRVLSYLPKEILSFSWNSPPSFPGIRKGDYHTWVVVSFKSLGMNRTEITLCHLGWPEGGDWDKVYDYFDKAWPRVLEWLEKSCNG